MIPLKALLDAGRYFLAKQQRSAGVSDEELIKIAVRSMGLNDIHKFKPEEKVIEIVMADKIEDKLINMNLKAFMDETASDSPAPGGGSVSAYMGALGVALGTMVANLSSHKRGWDDRWKEFSDWAEKGKAIQNNLLELVDEDTRAFKKIMEAFSLPRKSEDERKSRDNVIQEATKNATLVPLKVMETAFSGFELISEMVAKGNPNSISDAGVGAIALRSCIKGAFLNIKINVSGVHDNDFAKAVIAKGEDIESKAVAAEELILNNVNANIRNH
jgi:glutamate formiminotransferase/formiminotetrahydrofolate cyclodeaminase